MPGHPSARGLQPGRENGELSVLAGAGILLVFPEGLSWSFLIICSEKNAADSGELTLYH